MSTFATPRQRARPGLLRRFNLEAVARRLQAAAPLSRADLARQTGISYPTVTKICDTLAERRFIEPCDSENRSLGHLGNCLRMSSSTAQVVSVAIGPDCIRVAANGLDGRVIEKIHSPAASSYEELLDTVDCEVRRLKRKRRPKTLGVGVCVPGLVDTTDERVIESPNVPVLNGRQVASDLRRRTKLPCTLVETMSAIFFAERIRGQAVDIDDFAIVNYRGGLGLAIASGGRLVRGSFGMAGELGHVIVDPGGERCGCGNRGCLETLATDLALAKGVSRKLRRTVSVDQLIDILRQTPERIAAEVDRTLDYLAIGVGAVINIFNPQAVFLCGRFLETSEELQARLIERVRRSSLKQLAQNCTIAAIQCNALEGAALAVVDELVHDLTEKRT